MVKCTWPSLQRRTNRDGIGRFQESSGIVRFPELTAQVLERVIQYLHHRRKYLESPVPVPEFDISNEEALELIMAANFLDC